jgi:hypothetical protein
MLQSVQAERGDGRSIRVAEDTENAALLAKPIVVGVEFGAFHGLSHYWFPDGLL